jgi:hypothetical protein
MVARATSDGTSQRIHRAAEVGTIESSARRLVFTTVGTSSGPQRLNSCGCWDLATASNLRALLLRPIL